MPSGSAGRPFAAGESTRWIFGMTSPLRMMMMREPVPMTFFSMKEALKPVAFCNFAPASTTALKCTVGFR